MHVVDGSLANETRVTSIGTAVLHYDLVNVPAAFTIMRKINTCGLSNVAYGFRELFWAVGRKKNMSGLR